MNNFKIIYKILSVLEKAIDLPEFEFDLMLNERTLNITRKRLLAYLEMLSDDGYIKGINIKENIIGDMEADTSNIKITLKGLEYLQTNSTIRQIHSAAKGIKEIVPFI